jgi:hypothetical protein
LADQCAKESQEKAFSADAWILTFKQLEFSALALQAGAERLLSA